MSWALSLSIILIPSIAIGKQSSCYLTRKPCAASATLKPSSSGLARTSPAGCRRCSCPSPANRRGGETSPNVFRRQYRKILWDSRLGHIRSQIFEHNLDGDAKPANARLATPLADPKAAVDIAAYEPNAHVSFDPYRRGDEPQPSRAGDALPSCRVGSGGMQPIIQSWPSAEILA